MYFDEAYRYLQIIKQRKNTDYKVQLAIAQNPHSQKPQDLWDILNKEDTITTKENDTLDTQGMELLKMKMRENPRIMIK